MSLPKRSPWFGLILEFCKTLQKRGKLCFSYFPGYIGLAYNKLNRFIKTLDCTPRNHQGTIAAGEIRQNIKFAVFWCGFCQKINVYTKSWCNKVSIKKCLKSLLAKPVGKKYQCQIYYTFPWPILYKLHFFWLGLIYALKHVKRPSKCQRKKTH